MEKQMDCRHFSGYKPCTVGTTCNSSCASLSPIKTKILLVHLGALGAVVRSTALLKAIHRKYPGAHVTWVTEAPAHHLLKNHPGIDQVLTTSPDDLLALKAQDFAVGLVIDKSLKANGVLRSAGSCKEVFGFIASSYGSIIPATAAAEELWEIGLNDSKKFFENKKTEIQLAHESLELGPYRKDPYWLPLTATEKAIVKERKTSWLGDKNHLIGINTGCSNVIAAKKLTVEMQRAIIEKLIELSPQSRIVLLGGPEDTERNLRIAKGLPVINSDSNKGLRDGLLSVAACDVIISGDSLGMHMGISQKVPMVTWFGPTCEHEIEFYGRGVGILTQAPCAPCWKRTCDKAIMCYDMVSLTEIVQSALSFISGKKNGKESVEQPSLRTDSLSW